MYVVSKETGLTYGVAKVINLKNSEEKMYLISGMWKPSTSFIAEYIDMKGDNKIDERKIPTKGDANEFVCFLRVERNRHIVAQILAEQSAEDTTNGYSKQAWQSSVIRHQEDIDGIDKTIKYLTDKWGL